MNTNARNKLRTMGGIMASSPELMQAAQGYQAGGPVMPQVPYVPRTSGYAPGLLPTGVVDPRLMSNARRAPTSPTQAQRNAELERAAMEMRLQGPLSAGGGARQNVPTPGVPFDRRVPAGPEAGQPSRMDERVIRNVLAGEGSIGEDAGVTVDDLLSASEQRNASRPETMSAGEVGAPTGPTGVGRTSLPTPETRGPKTAAQRRAERIDTLRKDSVAAAADFVKSLPNPAEALSDYANRFGAEAAGVVSSALGATETGAEFFEAAEGISAGRDRRQDVDAAQERGPGTTPAPPRPVYDNPVFMENLLPPGAQEPTRAEKIKQRAEEELSKDAEFTAPTTDTDAGGTGGAGGPPPPPPEPTKKDLRSRYKEKIELFKEIYGESDEDRARDKAMSLAMLGLAIASGQSPDALTNIAQGAAVGLQGMSEQEQARREREQGLQTLALETAIGEMDAERAAEEAALDRQNRLDAAEIRSGGSGYGSRVDPATAYLRIRGDLSGSTEYMGADTKTLDTAAYQQLLNTYGNIPYVADLGRRLGIEQPAPVMSPEEANAAVKALEG